MKSLFKLLLLIWSLVLLVGPCYAKPVSPEIQALLPAKIGDFRQAGSVRPIEEQAKEVALDPLPIRNTNDGTVEYRSKTGKLFLIQLVQFPKDADAYSCLTLVAQAMRERPTPAAVLIETQVGTASVSNNESLAFYKGRTFVRVTNRSSHNNETDEALELAGLLSNQIDKGEGEVPVLVKHLPDWEDAQKRATYLAGFKSLQAVVPEQSVLSVPDASGDADAVVANYGAAKVLLVEFNTPQLAGENDRAIVAKIQILRSQNQPIPTAYRRVGNYGVFVFNAESEQAANALIDKVQYEQVVQWLGDNPYWFKEAQRRYTETTLGVLVAVVKASGLTLVGCFGLGGLIGAILFTRRRAQQATAEAFSDAGGMLRLNLDEMTPQTDPTRLLPDRH
ncbi:MAG TPA: DUF6599 family protein [Pyrinomonadaceae bacterium]